MKKFVAGWRLIYTRPNHERKVQSRLTEKKIECFLPTRKVLKEWHDRKKYVDEPLFPSYIFIYLNDMQDYYEGMNMDGCLYYVRSGKEIATVPDEIVNNIRLVNNESHDIQVTSDQYGVGRQLVINKGVLTGLACEVVKVNNKEMLLVRVDLLSRSLLVSMHAEHLMVV